MTDNPRHRLIEQCLRFLLAVFVVAVVLAVYPRTLDPASHFKQVLTAWVAGAGGLLWFFGVAALGLPVRRPRISLELLLCLLGFMALSTLAVSDFKGYSLVELSIFVPLFALYLIVSQVIYEQAHVRFLIQWICVGVALGSIYGFMQKFGADPFPWADKESDVYLNLPAMYGNPNFAAHVLILAIILAGYMVSVGQRVYLGFIALFAAHLWFTDQRAGLVALAAAGLLLLVARALAPREAGRHAARRAVLAVAVTGLFCAVGAAGLMAVNTVRTGHPFPLDLSLLIRYQSYVSASNMILAGPLLGHGPGVYKISYAPFWTTFEQEWFAQEDRMNAHVHNDLMELAIDAGLPAAGLYMAVLLMAMCFGILLAYTTADAARQRLGYVLAAFFVAFAGDGLFGFNLRVPVSAALFFIALGMLEGVWSAPGKALVTMGARARAALPAAALAAALLACVYFQTRVYRSEVLLFDGSQYLEAERPAEAREPLTQGERLAPWNWIFGLRLGLLAKAEGNHLESIDHFERSLERNPYYIMTHLAAAQSHLLLAQQQLDSMPKVMLGRGNTEDEANISVKSPEDILQEGRKHAERIRELCPVYPRAFSTLGRIASLHAITLARAQDQGVTEEEIAALWAEAEQNYAKAIELGVSNVADKYRLLARVRHSLGKMPQAEDALTRAAQINPADPLTWELYFQLSASAGRFDRMRDTLAGLVSRLSEDPEGNAMQLARANMWLATVHADGYQDLEAADNAWRGALRAQPLDAGLWSRFGEYALALGRVSALEEVIREICVRLENVDQRKPLDHVAAILRVIQEGDAAVNDATRVLLAMFRAHAVDSPLRPEQAYGWAIVYCRERIAKSGLSSGDFCESFLNIGIMLAGMKQFEQAEAEFAKGQDCFTPEQRAIAAVYLADTYLFRGRVDDAVALLRDAATLDPGNLDVKWALARALTQGGNPEEARTVYEALLAEQGLDAAARAQLEAEYGKLK